MMPFGPRFFVNIVKDKLLHMKAEVFAKALYLISMGWDWGQIEPIELGKL